MRNIDLGRAGEKTAARYLKKQGYKILARNAREFCEIDLVAAKGAYIVFVEVKTRSGLSMGLPREAVDAERQTRYRRAAAGYLKRNKISGVGVRFDVIEVLEGKITHIPDAF